jgi:hypothetical protein
VRHLPWTDWPQRLRHKPGIARIDGQWMLSNQSRSWVCALNGQRIGVGKRPALFDGDVLELGLLRFEVDAMHGSGHGTAEAPPPPWVRF